MLFISESESTEIALEVKRGLEERGYVAVFVAGDDLRAGADWVFELHRSLEQCTGIVVLWNRAAERSRWVFHEGMQAVALRVPIFTVRLDDASLPSAWRRLQGIDVRKPRSSEVPQEIAERVVKALRNKGRGPDVAPGWPLNTSESPFPGLRPFDVGRRHLFLKREQETREVVRHVLSQLDADVRVPVLLAGPSGAGKSSIVRAAVLPQLQAELGEGRIFGPVVPSEFRQSWGSSVKVLVVDQLEQYWTRLDERGRREFGQRIDELYERGAVLLGTLRSSFIGRMQKGEAPRRMRGAQIVSVENLKKEQVHDCIAEQARRVNWEVKSSVVTSLVDRAQGQASLAMFAMAHLWRRCGDRSVGVREALTAEVLDREFPANGEDFLTNVARQKIDVERLEAETGFQRAVLNMIDVGRGDTLSALSIGMDEVEGSAKEIFEKLSPEFFVLERGRIEFAHQAVISRWKPVRTWTRRSREAMEARRAIDNAAADWDENEQAREYLWEVSRLRPRMISVESSKVVGLEATARQFVRACEVAARRRGRLRGAAAFMMVALFAIVVYFFEEGRIAERQNEVLSMAQRASALMADRRYIEATREFAGARGIADAEALREGSVTSALRSGFNSGGEAHPGLLAEAFGVKVFLREDNALEVVRDRSALTVSGVYETVQPDFLSGHSIGVSPRGEVAVASGTEVYVLTPGSVEPSQLPLGEPPTGRESWNISSVEFSPMGEWLVVVDSEPRLLVYDLREGIEEAQAPATISAGPVGDVWAFDPEGTWFAHSVQDGVRILEAGRWDDRGQTIQDHREALMALAFDGSGTRLYSGSWDGQVNLYRIDASRKEWRTERERGNVANVNAIAVDERGGRVFGFTYAPAVRVEDEVRCPGSAHLLKLHWETLAVMERVDTGGCGFTLAEVELEAGVVLGRSRAVDVGVASWQERFSEFGHQVVVPAGTYTSSWLKTGEEEESGFIFGPAGDGDGSWGGQDLQVGTTRLLGDANVVGRLNRIESRRDGELVAIGGDNGRVDVVRLGRSGVGGGIEDVVTQEFEGNSELRRNLTLGDADSAVLDLQFSPVDPNVLALAGADDVRLVHLESGELLYEGSESEGVQGVGFSADGRWFVWGDDAGDLIVVDTMESYTETWPLKYEGKVWEVGVCGEGWDAQFAAGGVGAEVARWRLVKGREPERLKGYGSRGEEVYQLDFSPDCRYLAWGTAEGTVVVVREDGVRIDLDLHGATVSDIDFSADGRRLMSLSDEGVASYIRLDAVFEEYARDESRSSW